jgi:hypothetical protein
MLSVSLSLATAGELSARGPSQRLGGKKGVLVALVGRLAFVLPFAGLLAWFQVADVYHLRFFEKERGGTSPAYLLNNCFRVLYGLYLIWALYYVGGVLLRALERKGGRLGLGLPEEVVLCFYAGAAIVSAAGFLLGYHRLYYFWQPPPRSWPPSWP